MVMSLDSAFGIHEGALRLQSQRARILAENLANADTPGYKARDIDFQSALTAAQKDSASGPLAQSNTRHIQPQGFVAGAEIMYRTPMQPSLDGNTVEAQTEMSAYTDNAMRYLASLRFLNGKINGLMSAIRGE